MYTRILTGKFYIKKRLFCGYDIIVEVNIIYTCDTDFMKSKMYTRYEKGTALDIDKLGINKIKTIVQ